ncbi:MAG: hypothetical protein RLZZ15_2120 [Verrucomicrobiota bacterium]|jgi:hypothetical protein
MMQPWIAVGLYLMLAVAFFAAIFLLRLWRRRDRWPFPDRFRLLRGPGESQVRLLRRLDDRMFLAFGAALAAPLFAATAFLWIATRLEGVAQLLVALATLAALVALLVVTARWLVARMTEAGNRHLGLFGERVVAEALDPLKAAGCRVFHDVPCGDAHAPFNIDHVLVGPGGVFVIETKTRRQGRSRAGFAAHEIIFDGNVLAYPWGEDRHGLDQAVRHARWLEDWLSSLLARRTPVRPLLAFPGWTIISRGSGAVTVLSPKEIPAAVAPRGADALDRREIEMVAAQLEARCRDVEF